MSHLISLSPLVLIKNIVHVGSFKHFIFVYLHLCANIQTFVNLGEGIMGLILLKHSELSHAIGGDDQ